MESSFSERNVKLIRSWLEQCDTDPSCCRVVQQGEFLPTRLLDVGAQGSHYPSITLVETQSMAQLEYSERSLKYICLSYRWGAAEPPLKTTKGTVEDHKAGIPMDSMPRVFRDAVLVARTLGIRYLWIDALCIIQGCAEDWHNESAAMADVFAHSWMTIGAAATTSCHETLFYPRQNLSINVDFRSSIKRNIRGRFSLLLLPEEDHDCPLTADLRNSAWNTRAWVWQEQKLSQRLLIFGERMLHLKCHQHIFHEDGRLSDWVKREFFLDTPHDWPKTINLYSRRELSKRSDRLTAISGSVKAASREFQDTGKSATYIAGIWLTEKTKTHPQLFWMVEDPAISFEQLLNYHSDEQQYIAPSWSWAALNQPVYTGSLLVDEVFNVVTHNIKPARSDPMIAIAPGSSITLLGELREIHGRPFTGIMSLTEKTKTPFWRAPYESYKDSSEGTGWWNMAVYGHIDYFLDWVPSTQSFTNNYLEADLKLFLLSVDLDSTSAYGLILYPTNTKERSFFRVGCFIIHGPWKSPGWKRTKVVVI